MPPNIHRSPPPSLICPSLCLAGPSTLCQAVFNWGVGVVGGVWEGQVLLQARLLFDEEELGAKWDKCCSRSFSLSPFLPPCISNHAVTCSKQTWACTYTRVRTSRHFTLNWVLQHFQIKEKNTGVGYLKVNLISTWFEHTHKNKFDLHKTEYMFIYLLWILLITHYQLPHCVFECVCVSGCPCICVCLQNINVTHSKLNWTAVGPTFAGQNITTIWRKALRSSYYECVDVCVCVSPCVANVSNQLKQSSEVQTTHHVAYW